MTKITALLALVLLVSPALWAVDGFKDPKARSALKKYDLAYARAEKDFKKKVYKARVTYMKDLNVAMKGALKKGNLEGAKKIDAAQKEIREVAEDEADSGMTARTLVIWNTNNGFSTGDRGTERLNVILLQDGKKVWEKRDVSLDWHASEDRSTKIRLPRRQFDRIRLEVVKWYGRGGGLTEVELLRGKKNLLRNANVLVSASVDHRFPGSNLTDGITTSKIRLSGYWLLPDAASGWIEFDLKKGASG